MSRYTVQWDPQAEADFTEAWTVSDSPTRAALTDVANWIDRELAIDAQLRDILT